MLSSENTMPWNPAYGAVSSGKRPAASQSKRPESASTPPTTVPWPHRNLVAEWKARSAP